LAIFPARWNVPNLKMALVVQAKQQENNFKGGWGRGNCQAMFRVFKVVGQKIVKVEKISSCNCQSGKNFKLSLSKKCKNFKLPLSKWLKSLSRIVNKKSFSKCLVRINVHSG
jgi:ATP-dependent helicase YprA (DUF1998 family)